MGGNLSYLVACNSDHVLEEGVYVCGYLGRAGGIVLAVR